jgi:hypothetical protein
VFFFEKKIFNLWFIRIYNMTLKKRTTSFKLIYNFLGKRWYLNLIYNRYIAEVSFFLGYSQTFILLDKGFFEAPTLLTVRYIGDLSKFLTVRFYRYFYFGELLLFFFLIYSYFNFAFFLNFDIIFEIIFPQVFSFLKDTFFSVFFFAVPRKKRTKKTFFINKIIKKCSLSALYIHVKTKIKFKI